MVAPSLWDDHYRQDFAEIINFQLDFARIIHEHENVVIIADKHTIPYLDGRVPSISKRLPYDALIEENLYDPNINNYAPVGFKSLVKFVYRVDEYADLSAKQIDDGINRFMMENHIHVDKREIEMALSGENLVENGVNRALVSKSVLQLNSGHVPEWAAMIKLLNAFKKAIVINHPSPNSTHHFNDLMTFIDDDILAVSGLNEQERLRLESELYSKVRDDIMVTDLSFANELERGGTCGLYTAALVTNKFIYLPVYGSNPENWKHGFSTMTDKMMLHMVEANTRKRVIPVKIPRSFCRRGLSLKSIAWTVKGNAAEQIISIPRKRFAIV
ncbi:hypothetical protein M3Y97_00477800 [Aphelenchoides bicaudatus]|nr:hypothetical protein M3Y97_00477800 [Aphelenchoides bicaudatus]